MELLTLTAGLFALVGATLFVVAGITAVVEYFTGPLTKYR